MAKNQVEETAINGQDDDEGMGFLNINLTDVPELVLLDDGEQYLRVVGATIKESKGEKTAGQRMINLRLESTEVPNSDDIFHIMMLPHPDAGEKVNIRRLNDIRAACDALGVAYSAQGVRINDFIGAEGWAVVTTEESPQYGKQNRISDWVTGA